MHVAIPMTVTREFSIEPTMLSSLPLTTRIARVQITVPNAEQSTFTPPELRGRGLARVVVDVGLEWARSEGKNVRAGCWYVAKVLEEERERKA